MEQVLGFIFLPGFSTARVVSDISGRGVGMDAVKRAVDEMNGNLRVRSTPGAGTTVTISLPLTMAIIRAVLVEASGSTYAIPISAVREIVKATGVHAEDRGHAADHDVEKRSARPGEPRPGAEEQRLGAGRGARSAPEAPAAPGQPPVTRTVVVVDYEGRKIGLEVDGILGSREVVIKSLSRHYREVEGLIGASILGNGKIALIVDVETMISHHSGSRSSMDGAALIRETVRATESPVRAIPSAALPAAASSAPPSRPAEPAAAPAAELEAAEAEIPAAHASSTAAPIAALARDVAGSRGRLLEEVNNQGAIQASMSLSQLTGQEIRVSFPESRLVAIKDMAEIMGGEESTVGGMYVGVQGDLEAGMLLVIPEANLLVLDDLLHRRPAGTAKDLAAIDLSGISEMGNLLASCFLNAMADAAHVALNPEVPEISIDMCLSVIDSVLARFNQPGDSLLLTEAVIYGGGSENVVCHQVLFLEPGSMRRLMDALSSAAERGADPMPRARSRRDDMEGDSVTVKMAEMEVISDGRNLKTVLGSCVGVVLRDPERKVSGLAHIMLPARRRDDESSGKYADSAIPALLARLASSGGRAGSLQALLIGGAQMFPMGNASIASIGDQNVQAARRVLTEKRIPIVFEDTGGTAGRSVVFSNATGKVAVKTLQAIRTQGEPRMSAPLRTVARGERTRAQPGDLRQVSRPHLREDRASTCATGSRS